MLAELLAVPAADLLTETTTATPSKPEPLDSVLGALLLVAGRAVSPAALATAAGTDTASVEAALRRLAGPLAACGLRLSVAKPGATLLTAVTPLGVAATRRLPTSADQRGGVTGPARADAPSTAQRRALGQAPKQMERHQLSVFVNAGWVRPPAHRAASPSSVEVDPDVLFSLALDDGEGLEASQASLLEPVGLRRKKFAWLSEDDPSDE